MNFEDELQKLKDAWAVEMAMSQGHRDWQREFHESTEAAIARHEEWLLAHEAVMLRIGKTRPYHGPARTRDTGRKRESMNFEEESQKLKYAWTVEMAMSQRYRERQQEHEAWIGANEAAFAYHRAWLVELRECLDRITRLLEVKIPGGNGIQ